MHAPALILIALLSTAVAWFVGFSCWARRWRTLVQQELERRSLVRVPSRTLINVDPADGYQLIETCTCQRDGRLYNVTVLHRRGSRDQLVVIEEPAA